MSDLFMDENVSGINGDIHIPTMANEYIIGQLVAWNYGRYIESPATVNDFSALINMPVRNSDAFEAVTTFNNYAYVSSNEYKYFKELVNNSIRWVWGDLESGGCYLYKNENNLYNFGIHYGLQEIARDGEQLYRYWFNDASNPNGGFMADALDTIVIGFADNAQFVSSFPSFTFQSATPFYNVTIYDLEIGYDDPVSPIFSYNPRSSDSIVDATNSTARFLDGGLFDTGGLPFKAWDPTAYALLYTQAPEGTVSGSWDGGTKIDKSKNPSWHGGNTNDAGGDGNFPNKSDDTSPDVPDYENDTDAINSGFVTLYTPTKAQIQAFNDFLFSDSITDNISAQLKKLIADPIDYLVFIAMVHFTPNKSAYQTPIKFVGINTGVTSKFVPSGSQIQIVDCGSINISEATQTARDYSPYTKATIYLPYVGYRELKIEEIMGTKNQPCKLSVKYYVDLMTGSFTCHVIVDRPYRTMWSSFAEAEKWKGTIAMYEGNCFEMLPISSTDFRQFYSGILSMVGGAVGIATGGGVASGLASMGSALMNSKTNVNRAGNVSSSFGFSTGNQKPFLILSRPFQAIPLNFGSYEGYPSNITNKVSYFDGYLETDLSTIWGTDISYEFEGTKISAFDVEIDEIKDLFEKGVYVNV